MDRCGGSRIRVLVVQFLSFHKSYSAAGESEAWVISGAGFVADKLNAEGEWTKLAVVFVFEPRALGYQFLLNTVRKCLD